MKYFSKFPVTGWDIYSNNKYKLVVDIFKNVVIKNSIKNNEDFYFEYYMNDGDTPEIIADKIYGHPEYHWVVLMMNDVINPHYDLVLNEIDLGNYIDGKYPGTALYITRSNNLHFKVGESISCTGTTTDTTVDAWDASYKRLIIPSDIPEFSEGETVTSSSGASGEIVRRDSYHTSSLHHIEINGIYKTPIVNIEDVDDTTDYLAQYMGGNTDSKFISNSEYETSINEAKRKIKLLKSDYLGIVIEQFESIIG